MPSSSGVEVRVGDDARDLDDHVVLDVEAGHLEVDPDQAVVACDGRHVDCTLPGRRRRVDSRAGDRIPPSSGDPIPSCCATSNVARFMAARGHRDVRRAGAAVDRRARMVLGRGRAVPRPPVLRAVHRGARHVGRHPVGEVVRRRSHATSRSAASTAGPTIPSAPTEPAVVWEGEEGEVRTLTCVELRTLTDRIASGLAARGVSAGDAVGLFLPMVPETVAALFAIAKLGARLPADLLRLRRRRGRDPARGRRRGRADHRRRLHAARPGRADEGDGRRRGRAGRRRCTPSSSCRASVAPTCRCRRGAT